MATCTETERAFIDSLLDNSNRYDLVNKIKYEAIPAALKNKLIKTAIIKKKYIDKWESLVDELMNLGFLSRDRENVIAQIESDAAALSESSETNA